MEIEFGHPPNDLHRLKAHSDDAQEQLQRILGIAHRLSGPEVGVVHDAAVGIFFDALAFPDQFEGGFAVDDLGVGFFGDVAKGDVSVVEDGGLVVDGLVGLGGAGFGELHFLHGDVFWVDRREERGHSFPLR